MTGAAARRALAGLLALLVLAAGCGLSADDEPRAISADDVPPELLDPEAATTTTVLGATSPVTVYLIGREGSTTRLRAVEREVTDPDRPGARIEALLQPPTEAERAAGLTSSIPTGTTLLAAPELSASRQELVIDLSSDFFTIEGTELALAFAQIVYTVTELEGVRRVRFQVDGEPRPALNAEGIEQPGPVTTADYVAFAPAFK